MRIAYFKVNGRVVAECRNLDEAMEELRAYRAKAESGDDLEAIELAVMSRYNERVE